LAKRTESSEGKYNYDDIVIIRAHR
jgi:hypothetical protein